MRMKISQTLNVILTTLVLVSSSASFADHAGNRFEGATFDAWLTGKIETVFTLNRSLNPFTIDTHVEHGRVTLSGEVGSAIDKSLAQDLAMGVDGVIQVENNLSVTGKPGIVERGRDRITDAGNDLMAWVDDATTSAAIKARLLANSETEGLDIRVTTENNIVQLEGVVASEDERNLAEEIAADTSDVDRVVNYLVVSSSR